jgi:hypothetical protein
MFAFSIICRSTLPESKYSRAISTAAFAWRAGSLASWSMAAAA